MTKRMSDDMKTNRWQLLFKIYWFSLLILWFILSFSIKFLRSTEANLQLPTLSSFFCFFLWKLGTSGIYLSRLTSLINQKRKINKVNPVSRGIFLSLNGMPGESCDRWTLIFIVFLTQAITTIGPPGYKEKEKDNLNSRRETDKKRN